MNLKYPKESYIDTSYFGGDIDCEYIDETEKLVKVRKQHECCGYGNSCKKLINIGDYAVVEKALFPGQGWKSCYICTSCIEEWLEESGQVESQESKDEK